jgi:hypothetical protein
VFVGETRTFAASTSDQRAARLMEFAPKIAVVANRNGRGYR